MIKISDELEGVGEFIPVDEAKMKTTLKAKLFSFHENRRPAYYGTWQKRTSKVKPRNPFAKDDVSIQITFTFNFDGFNFQFKLKTISEIL